MTDYDVAIIGGGAAGLSAALVLGRARRRVIVLDAGVPRNAPAAHMHGFLSRDGMAPADLLARGRDEARGYGVDLVEGTVTGSDDLPARAVLLAMGAEDLLPDIAGARERWGRDFLHCPYCHGWEVRDRPIGVLGSEEHARLLRQWSDDVVLFGDDVVALVVEDDRLRGVELADGTVVEREVVFMRPTLRPSGAALIDALGCERDASGFVRADAAGATSVPGVWAAGNVCDPRAQVVTAAGQGSAAAIAINTHLVQHDRKELA